MWKGIEYNQDRGGAGYVIEPFIFWNWSDIANYSSSNVNWDESSISCFQSCLQQQINKVDPRFTQTSLSMTVTLMPPRWNRFLNDEKAAWRQSCSSWDVDGWILFLIIEYREVKEPALRLGMKPIGLQKLMLFLDCSLKHERVKMIGRVNNDPCKSRWDLSANTTRPRGILCRSSPQNLWLAGCHASPVWISPRWWTSPTDFPVKRSYQWAIYSGVISLSSIYSEWSLPWDHKQQQRLHIWSRQLIFQFGHEVILSKE